MNIVQSIIMGIVQGLTEFLPVSSSGHLVIISDILHINDSLFFDVFLHVTSLFAVLFYFRKKFLKLITSFFSMFKSKKSKQQEDDLRYIGYLALATIPAAALGYLFDDKVAQLFASVKFAGLGLLVTAMLLYFSDKISLSSMQKKGKPLSFAKVIIIGFAQALAIMPGISRSGSTVAAALFNKISRRDAAEFSFLLSIPIIAGAFIFKLSDIGAVGMSLFPLAAGGLACFLASYLAISTFIKIISKYSLKYFSLYCLILGLGIVIFK